ncbi:MAG: hypothetical protein HN576_15990 [Bacteriovoracaceae bacterium]|jgi:hypothetical protein|nr:hypothetical protein [Bacteriovoracaceae bacterium]
MKKLIIAFGLTLFSLNANALYLQTCYNHTVGNQAVSYSYQSCINRNFRAIEREIRRTGNRYVYLQNCSNFGDLVDYSFTTCINRNFRSVERVIRKPIFLNMCTNFTPTRLDFSFENCVRSNNRNLERAL